MWEWRRGQLYLATRVVGGWAVMAVVLGASVAMPQTASGQAPTINTWAGGGPAAGAPGLSTSLGNPNAVAADSAGNLYVVSSLTRRIYRVEAGSGAISVVAGGGPRAGTAADGRPATEADLNAPSSLAWRGDGLYVAAFPGVRRIDTLTGVITTVLGGGPLPFTSGMQAVALTSACVGGLAVAATGDLYTTDPCTHTIKRIDTGGRLTLVAGTTDLPGLTGDGGRASVASLQAPGAIAVSPFGDLALLDQSGPARRVRRITAGADGIVTGTADEIITSLTAGGCCASGPVWDGQPALTSDMRGLISVAFDRTGRLLVSQAYEGPGWLWHIDAAGTLHLLAGAAPTTANAAPGYGDGGPALQARFGAIAAVVETVDGLVLADSTLQLLRRVEATSAGVTRLAGNGAASYGGDGGPVASSQLLGPSAIEFDGTGNALFVDQDARALRRVDAATGHISSIVPVAFTFLPLTIARHPANGRIYFVNSDDRVYSLNPLTGSVTVEAGTGVRTCSFDCEGGDPRDDLGDNGLAANATFRGPTALAFDAAGHLYLTDIGNHRVRRIDAVTGFITTVAGIDISGNGGFAGDGGPARNARLKSPRTLAIAPDGTLFIADTGNSRIRRVAPTAAGTATLGAEGIDTIVSAYGATSFAVEAPDRLFFTGVSRHDVGLWAAGAVTTIVNVTGISGFAGDGGPAVDARLLSPKGLALSGGALYIADSQNNRIRVVTTSAPTAPDLTVTKTTASTFQQGGAATYDLAVSNIGTAPTTGTYTVTDMMPAGLTASGASGAGWDCTASTTTTISCTSSGTLTAGQAAPVVAIGVNIATAAPASVTNTASVAGGGEIDTTNNTSSVTSPVTQLVPDLTITKSTTSTFQQGGTATYDFVVSNVGNGASTGAYTIADTLPAGLTLAGTTPGAGWDCAASTSIAVSCTRTTTLAAGQTAPAVTISVAIAATAPASVTNTATTTGGGETDTTNNTSSVTSPVTQLVPDLTITKSTTSTFQQGGTATYDFVVSNVGNGASTGAYTIADTLPAGLTLAGTTPGAGWDCAASTSIAVSCTRTTTLAAGQTAPAVTISVAIAATAPASVTNTATTTGGGETDTTNNTSSVTSPVNQLVPDLTITKSTTSTFLQGSTATYDFVVRNTGNGSTTGAYTITDTLPAGLTLAGATPGAGWDCAASTTIAVSCTRTTTLAAGQTAPAVIIAVNIAATAPASITNTASINGGAETDTTNNTTSVTSAVTPAVPDLTITKFSPSTFQAGGTAIYALTARNSGNGPTIGAYTITDALPAGLTLAGTTPGAGWDCTASTTTVVSCVSSTTLPAGQAAPAVTIAVNIAATAPASITNTATIAGGGETNTVNNASTVTNILAGSGNPDLALTKTTTSTTFFPGGTATYTFTVRNVGTGPTRAAYTVTDQLPQGLQLVQSPTGAGWTCSVVSARVTCTNSTVIPAGGTAPMLTMPVIVAPLRTAPITNTAFVGGGGEAFAAGNNFSAVTTPVGQSDLAISIAASSPLVQGGAATFTFTVANVGTAPAQGARVDLHLGWLPSPSVVAPGSGWTCTSSPLSSSVTCTRSTPFAPGESASITASLTIPTWWPSTATVAARVSAASDANYANNSASLSSPVTPVGPDLAISAVASGPLQQGGTVSYTLTVSNQGSAAASGGSFWVINPKPVGLTFTAASGTGWTCTVSGGSFVCRTYGPLAAGAAAPVITATATIDVTAPASITNRSVVPTSLDIDLSNNWSLVTSSVAPR